MATDYISREAAIKEAYYLYPSIDHYCTSVKAVEVRYLNAIPAADVEPIRHAHWIFQKGVFANDGTKGCFECSACKATVDLETFDRMCECGQTRKCGACGARMDEEVNQ